MAAGFAVRRTARKGEQADAWLAHVLFGGVDVVKRDVDAALLRCRDNKPSHFGWNSLTLPFVVTDVALRDANGRSECSLG